MRLRQLLATSLGNAVLCISLFVLAGLGSAAVEEETATDHSLAHFNSWVLFGGRAVQGAPFLAYGYLSEVAALPHNRQQKENESSAVLAFVVEGSVVDMQQSNFTLKIESQGTLRIFFNPEAKRDFSKPDSFRTGKEVARYNLQRQVLFNPGGGWIYDRSFASLVSSQPFSFRKTEIDLLRLWGPQLTINAQAHAGNGLPSPLPEYSGALPYRGKIFVDAERTDSGLQWWLGVSLPCCIQILLGA
jgi:hypothetical protein